MGFILTLILSAMAFLYFRKRYWKWTRELETQGRLQRHRDVEIAKIKRLTDRRY